MQKPTDYGTNNEKAFAKDECPVSTSEWKEHKWIFLKNLGNCYNMYFCYLCDAVHRIDSSD